MIRKGAARGTGRGYKNLRHFPKDPMIHAQAARGMKQPQQIRRSLYGWRDIGPFKRGKALRPYVQNVKKFITEHYNGRNFTEIYKHLRSRKVPGETIVEASTELSKEKKLFKSGKASKQTTSAEHLANEIRYLEDIAEEIINQINSGENDGMTRMEMRQELEDVYERLDKLKIREDELIEKKTMRSGGKDPKPKFDEVAAIMAYEGGEASEEEIIDLFSHLIKNGHAWSLQGMYGRQASALIEAGILDKNGNRITKKPELVRGGLGDGKPDSAFDIEELKKGINIEMEHTDDPAVAKEIAKDHLTEDKEYYVKLAEMERGDKESEHEDATERFEMSPARRDYAVRRERAERNREERARHGQHTNTTIGSAFFAGATRGRSNNMRIVDTPTETLLVGYGLAVYGARNKATGETTYYSGWRGYSHTTSKHLGETGLASADHILNERRQI